jgi:hypothetical protein
MKDNEAFVVIREKEARKTCHRKGGQGKYKANDRRRINTTRTSLCYANTTKREMKHHEDFIELARTP